MEIMRFAIERVWWSFSVCGFNYKKSIIAPFAVGFDQNGILDDSDSSLKVRRGQERLPTWPEYIGRMSRLQ